MPESPDRTPDPGRGELLRFDAATLPGGEVHDTRLVDVDLAVPAGALVLVRLERRRPRVPLVDAALGLLAPAAGRVSFLGVPWEERSPAEAARARADIGCVFERGEWVSNLELDKNVLLAERHNTQREEDEIRSEAEALARRFGLGELPSARPHALEGGVLRRAACVRALLGQPRLVLLERPTRDAFSGLVDPLLEVLGDARARGTGVLWTTTSEEVMGRVAPRADRVLAAQGERLEELATVGEGVQ